MNQGQTVFLGTTPPLWDIFSCYSLLDMSDFEKPWPRIRGQRSLQLAGYDISHLPMASLCAGLSMIWPTEVAQNHVPSL